MTHLHRLFIALFVLTVVAVSVVAQNEQPRALEDLREEARRLTLLAELPEEARGEAEALLDRHDALQQRRRDEEARSLEAYVSALRDGEPAAVARELAEQAVADVRLELLREQEALAADIEAFAQRFPEARALLLAPGGPGGCVRVEFSPGPGPELRPKGGAVVSRMPLHRGLAAASCPAVRLLPAFLPEGPR